MRIEPITTAMLDDWLALRLLLWPQDEVYLRAGAGQGLARSDALNLIAHDEAGKAIGFIEATLRHDHVNGCDTSPVAFVEGLYVLDGWRGRGVARDLVTAVESWARAQGVTELASDAMLDNRESQAMHEALGFQEMERVVYFRKPIS